MRKILLTGEPRVGKTTLFRKLIASVPRKQGFLTEEVRKDGERIGFNIVTASGTVGRMAGIDHVTPHVVQGRVSRYYVDVATLDTLIAPLLAFKPDDLLYIDEIGQMELFSDAFKHLVETYLQADQPFLGTISKVYRDPFSKELLERKDVTLIEVTMENRDRLADELARLLV